MVILSFETDKTLQISLHINFNKMKSKLLILYVLFSLGVSAQNLNTIIGTTLGGSGPTTSGTLLANTTYTVVGNIIVPIHDTLFLQSGVTVCVESGYTIIVKGALISLGTETAPNWFTACGVVPVDQVGNNPATDPAWNGGNGEWTGINCDTSSRLVVLKWTHVLYTGATFATTLPFVGGTAGSTSNGILFQSAEGCFIMEDSWMYGTTYDAIFMNAGKFDLMRNTFEKAGYIGGDCLDMRNGAVGDCAYNLFIGCATNGCRASNKGGGGFAQCNANIYNNTFVDGGYRQASYASRGSDIDYEQGAKGSCYNNLIVNCRNGIRVANGENSIPWPDTTNLFIGSNYIYADSVWEVNQFFPVIAGTATKPSAYVIPTAVQLNLPAHFYDPSVNPGNDDLAYNDPALATLNNPLFVNFSLPEPVSGFNLSAIASVNTGVVVTGHPYNFHLQVGSPAVGIGNPNASYMLNACASITNPDWGPNENPPCIDMGCFPNSCSLLTGTGQLVNNSNINVYPNPSHGSFVITSSNINEKCNVYIFNMLGEKVYTQSLNDAGSSNVVSLTGRPNGIYLYRVLKEDGSLVGSGKIVVQK